MLTTRGTDWLAPAGNAPHWCKLVTGEDDININASGGGMFNGDFIRPDRKIPLVPGLFLLVMAARPDSRRKPLPGEYANHNYEAALVTVILDGGQERLVQITQANIMKTLYSPATRPGLMAFVPGIVRRRMLEKPASLIAVFCYLHYKGFTGKACSPEEVLPPIQSPARKRRIIRGFMMENPPVRPVAHSPDEQPPPRSKK